MTSVSAGPVEETDPALTASLRADLAPFTVDALQELLGPVATGALDREQAVPAALVAREHRGEPLGTLLAAFVLGLSVTRDELARALPRLGVDGAARLGLIEPATPGGRRPQPGADRHLRGAADDPRATGDPHAATGPHPGGAAGGSSAGGGGAWRAGVAGEVRATVELRPYAAVDDAGTANWWLVSDLGDLQTGAPLRPDHVLGVGGASTTLAHSTVRTPVGRVLDIGTGCGVQAVHAARHARHVTGTDTSPRALRFARLAWQLNAIEDVPLDLRRGSLLEPVEGETFDLVVSNPPFVITPRAAGGPVYQYRDAGLAGDSLVRRLLAAVPAALAPGGVAQLLGNWEHHAGEPWQERLAGWLDPGIDAWVVQREVQDPAEYAELWMRDAGQHAGPGADELYAAWLADFAARGVEAVGFGLITLRRPVDGAASLRRLEERRSAPELPAGHEVAAGLAAHDWLRTHDDATLLETVLTVAPDVTEERHHRPGEADPTVVLLRQGGSGRVIQASTALAGLVGACDGELTVGRITGALGVLLDRPADSLVAELVPAVRGLVEDGLLVP